MKKNTTEYIKDILICIDRIEKTVKGVLFEKYVSDIDKIDIVERNLIKLGDIVERIPQEVQDRYENVQWTGIKSLRNRLTHEYPDIKNDTVWDVIEKDLPELKKQIIKIHRDIGNESKINKDLKKKHIHGPDR